MLNLYAMGMLGKNLQALGLVLWLSYNWKLLTILNIIKHIMWLFESTLENFTNIHFGCKKLFIYAVLFII